MNQTAIFDTAQTVLDCVCEQMDAIAVDDPTYPGCPCLTYVSAGEPQIDCCTTECEGAQGSLTVHVESVYPSDTFPNLTATFEPCKAQTWVAVLVVTAARCAPSMDEQGNNASATELTANAELMATDQYAVLTALSCCVVNEPPLGKRKRRVLIQESRPLVSEGGCASVEVRAAVEIGQVCACPSGES